MKRQKRNRWIFLVTVAGMLTVAGTDAHAYLAGGSFQGPGSQCLAFMGDGTFEAFGGTYSGPYSELQLVSGLVLQLPFITFWQGLLNDPAATQFVGVNFFGFLYARVTETAGTATGRFLGVRTPSCP